MVQVDIVGQVEVGAARKVFDLSMTELGPYTLDFTRSGRYMAIAGRAGHLALMEWQKGRLISEVQVDRSLCSSWHIAQTWLRSWHSWSSCQTSCCLCAGRFFFFSQIGDSVSHWCMAR